MNKFSERFKGITDDRLLLIIENPNDYDIEAVDAAKLELANRGFTVDEIKTAKEDLKTRLQELDQRHDKLKLVEQKVSNGILKLIDLINPASSKNSASERRIKGMALFFVLYSTYHLFSDIRFLSATGLVSTWGELDWYWISLIIGALYLPVATVLYVLRKRSGWMMLCGYLIYQITNTVLLYTNQLMRSNEGDSIFDSFMPQYLLSESLITIAFFTALVWAITGKSYQEYFNLNKRIIIGTFLVAILYPLSIFTFIFFL